MNSENFAGKEQLIEKLKARKEYGSPNGHKLVPLTIEEIDYLVNLVEWDVALDTKESANA